MVLQDSGARKEFPTGAVRDVHDGKGRCDLLPLDVVIRIMGDRQTRLDRTFLSAIEQFMRTGDSGYLVAAARFLIDGRYPDFPSALLELAMHYEDGAAKYSPNNWKKGISLHCYIDSAIRHYLKHIRGDTDEPHARAVLWNLVGAVWTMKHKPDMIDIEFGDTMSEEASG